MSQKVRIVDVIREKVKVVEKEPETPKKQKVIVLRKVKPNEKYVQKDEIPVSIGIPQYYYDLQREEVERRRIYAKMNAKYFIFFVGGPKSGITTQIELLQGNLEFLLCEPRPQEPPQQEATDEPNASTSQNTLSTPKDQALAQQSSAVLEGEVPEQPETLREVTVDFIKEELEKTSQRYLVITDFPNSEEDLAEFEEKIQKKYYILYLDSPDEVLEERHFIEHEGEVQQEEVDAVKEKISIYRSKMDPIIDKCLCEGKVIRVNANRPIEDVYNDVSTIIADIFAGEYEFRF